MICIGIYKVLYQAISNTLPTRWRQPPSQFCCCAVLSGQEHHWETMRGGSSGKIGAIGPVDKISYMMGLHALIEHDGRCCPMATMGPHSSIGNNVGQKMLVTKSLRAGKKVIFQFLIIKASRAKTDASLSFRGQSNLSVALKSSICLSFVQTSMKLQYTLKNEVMVVIFLN